MSRIMGFIHDHVADAGHSVDFLTAEDVPASLTGRRARFSFPLLVLDAAVRAARRGAPYDLVNVHEPASCPIAVLRRIAGNPIVVVTSHGVEQRAWDLALEELRLGRAGPSFKSRLIHPLTSLWQSKSGLRHADAVFCLNSEDRGYLQTRFRLPPNRITCIYPGAAREYCEAALGRDYSRATRLLFSATWRKNKGIEDLVPAFVSIAKRNPDLRLQILGAGFDEKTVLADFPEPLRSRVSCLTASNDTDSAMIYAQADLFVLPSLFEGTPLTLLEAMATGLPAVTTDTCGMKDVIRDGYNGLLVPIRSPEAIAEALSTLIANPAVRQMLGSNASKAIANERTWRITGDRVLLKYESLYDRCRRQRQ